MNSAQNPPRSGQQKLNVLPAQVNDGHHVDTGQHRADIGHIAPKNSQFLTVSEVADLMRVSKMTVYRLVHSGELPAVRVGRSFRVRTQVVHDYLQEAFFDAG